MEAEERKMLRRSMEDHGFRFDTESKEEVDRALREQGSEHLWLLDDHN